MKIPVAVLAATMLTVSAEVGPVVAQTQQQLDWCAGVDDPTPDLQIDGCTAVIQSGKLTGRDLATTFYNRSVAYSEKRDFDRAIADLDEAIRLDPNYADAFNLRALAKRGKGDSAGAEVDFARAKELKTKAGQ